MGQNQVALGTLAAFSLLLLGGCSGSRGSAARTAPVFTSTPPTQAVEGSVYSYQLTTSDAKDTFSLSSAPAGATLSGNTISWIPAATLSRASNSFSVIATSPAGTSATQSWTVSPNGTIYISRIVTLWNESGSTNVPFDWSHISSFVAALVPHPDGSFTSLSGTPGTNGDFEIPNVPAGYFWLRLGPKEIYWTSSSTFDAGTDLFALNADGPAPANTTTTFNFSFTSLDSTATNGWLQFTSPDSFGLKYSSATRAGSTDFTGTMSVTGNLDFSEVRNAFAAQYKQITLGYLNGLVLGPELTLTNLSLTTGATNTISGALNPSVPAFLNLSVEASDWIPLFEQVAPAAPTAIEGGIYVYVQPYTDAGNPNVPWESAPIGLIATVPATTSGFILFQSNCSGMPPSSPSSTGFSLGTTLQPMTTDVEAGNVQYSDPFPAAWRRTFSVCQNASVDVPVPGTSTTQSIVLTNSQTTSLPEVTVKPLISPVQSPKINGTDLFAPSTIANSPATLSWNPPAIGKPYGYQVTIESPYTLPNGAVNYLPLAILSTATTSVEIPPDLLASGHTYLFMISSLEDGRANMETSPDRSSLPVARADLISAPITIGTAQAY